jgi:tetratricopeptide (TPR) repeat protein
MQKKNAEGLGYLQKAKEVDPTFLNSYFNTATYYAATGDQEKALAEYRTVLQKDPQNIKALLTLAGYYESKGSDSEALAYFGKAIETKEPSAYVALANFYMKKNQSAKALAMIDDAIKKMPKNPDLFELKGRIYQVDKKTKDAISAFDQVEAINPERGIRLKIQTYIAGKEYNRASEEARRYIEITPKSARGYMILAEIYEAQGSSDRAIEELKKAARAESTSGAPLIQLGYTYARKKDNAQALSVFEEAARKDPKSSAPALFGIGTIYEGEGKKLEAVKKYKDALQKSPNYVPALNNLATLYADGIGGKPAEALPLAESAVRSDPNSPNILDTYGYVLLKNGRTAEARKVLERVSSVAPDNPSVNYHLALAYRQTGDRAQAISRVNKALEVGRFPEEAQAKQLLAELTGVRKAR